MMTESEILVGITPQSVRQSLILAMANRHGLITGTTGTGKTVTLQRLAEQFSLAGVPVFLTDVKGDLAGLAYPGEEGGRLANSFQALNIPFTPHACSVNCWDLYGKKGLPLRTTISELGPLLLGRILEANPVQQGVINAAFSVADDQGLLLLDLKDFRSLLDWILSNSSELKTQYGNFSRSSVGAIQRGLLTLSEAGGEQFFGEPALKLEHIMQKTASGEGMVSLLDATQLIQDPRLYTTFLLWLLSELFEQLPEVGDLDKPRLVFFFDEAHLFFNSAPKPLIEKIEQVVRLIRSKGVGIYFISQNPSDIPDNVLSQLNNRVQHALRAFTPKDQKAVKVAAQTFRQNPDIDIETVITELNVGEALVSFLDAKGSPTPVEKVQIVPPYSRVGAITDQERQSLVTHAALGSIYATSVDRESAYEMIQQKLNRQETSTAETAATDHPAPQAPQSKGRPRQGIAEVFIRSTARALGSQLGQKMVRGILGSIFKSK